jgi:hypothetical protein
MMMKTSMHLVKFPRRVWVRNQGLHLQLVVVVVDSGMKFADTVASFHQYREVDDVGDTQNHCHQQRER